MRILYMELSDHDEAGRLLYRRGIEISVYTLESVSAPEELLLSCYKTLSHDLDLREIEQKKKVLPLP